MSLGIVLLDYVKDIGSIDMARELAIVTRVQKIESIPNYDRVVKATIENYPVIVQKDQVQGRGPVRIHWV